MTAQKDNPAKLLWMLGLAMTLPFILLSGPLAGYLIGFWLTRQFGIPSFCLPILMVLGLLGSGWQTYLLIQKLNKRS